MPINKNTLSIAAMLLLAANAQAAVGQRAVHSPTIREIAATSSNVDAMPVVALGGPATACTRLGMTPSQALTDA